MELDPLGRPVRKPFARGSRRRGWIIAIGVGVLVLVGWIGFLLFWDPPLVMAPDLQPEPMRPLADADNGRLLFDGFGAVPFSNSPELGEALRMTRPIDKPGGGWPPWDRAVAEEAMRINAPLLEAAEQSLERPEFRYRAPKFDEPAGPVLVIYEAAQVLALDAWSRFRSGDQQGAVRRAVQILHLGWRVIDGNGDLASWNTGSSIAIMGAEALRHFAGESESRAVVAQVLTAHKVLKRDSASMADQLQQSIAVTFSAIRQDFAVRGHVAVTARLYGRLSPNWKARLQTKPNSSLRLAADLFRELQRNVQTVPAEWDWPVADSYADPFDSWVDRIDPNLLGRQLIAQSAGFTRGIAGKVPRLQTQQAFTLLMAALRLYEMDGGELPAALEELVPEYLDQLPPDPYNGESLRYDPARRMVWSVGADLVDRGGEAVELSGSEWRAEPTLIIP